MSKFRIEYNMKDRGLPTLFKHQYFTIDSAERQNWDYDNLDSYLGEYCLHVSENVKNKFDDNSTVLDVITDLDMSKTVFEVSRNNAERYSGKKQYIKCRISKYVLKAIKKIFISTLVYESEGVEIPESESIVFEFDSDKKVVEIEDINIHEPADNPFFKYARNAVDSLSVEAIGIKQYAVEGEKIIKDFYDRTQMSQWKERKKLEKESEIAGRAGVYMLYDEVNNTFYVGKAISLKDRIIQHANNVNGNDPIPDFTHYRYSVISPEYYEFLYLIENAAIHDFAWLLDMPSAQKYTPSLAKITGTANLSKCRMVNTAEHQTRKQ